MKMKSISSSHVTGAGYDENTKTMDVSFKNGATYRYSFVPLGVYEGLIGASSAGAYMHSAVRGRYDFIII